MKFICNECDSEIPCKLEADIQADVPSFCPWSELSDANWKELKEPEKLKMLGVCYVCKCVKLLEHNGMCYDCLSNRDWKCWEAPVTAVDVETFGICADCANNYANNDKTCSACGSCKDASHFDPKRTRVEQKREAATPQPSPIGCGDMVLPEFIKDVYARADAGHKKYGTYLRTNNDRDALMDAYQECIDMGMYLKQAIMERSSNWEDKIRRWAEDRGLYEAITTYSQCKKIIEETIEWLKEANGGDMPPTRAEMIEIGDMLVVLTNIANSRGVSLQECGWMAYEKIKDRTGHIENGTFVRDQD